MEELRDKFFERCFYTPVSFVLFLLALTFPQDPTVENIAVINLWLTILFEILPLKGIVFSTILQSLNFDAEHNPLKTRADVVKFVFAMHKYVLGEDLDVTATLLFFEKLRATDCSKNIDSTEASCTRKSQRTPSVCVLYTTTQKMEMSCFWIDAVISKENSMNDSQAPRTQTDIWNEAMNDSNAFCSCVFSAKWFLMHLIAHTFPIIPGPADKYKYHTFLTLFGKILACFACRVNFQANMELVQYTTKTDLLSAENFRHFVHRLHSTVNGMLNKLDTPDEKITLQETSDFFDMLLIKTSPLHMCTIMIAQEHLAHARYYFSP